MSTLPRTPETMHLDPQVLLDRYSAAPPGPTGVVRVELTDHAASWTVRFSATEVVLDPRAAADVVLRLPAQDAAAVLAGDADGALLYLGGRLQVAGEERLVLALGSVLHAPGADRPLIDPAALDPQAVAAAIVGVGNAHLDRVMSGPFRDLVLDEVFRRLPGFLIPEKAPRVRVAVMFEIENGATGQADRVIVRVQDGLCAVESSATPDAVVDATLVLAGNEFLRLVLGQLNPVRGVLSGQVRVRGQVLKALAFSSVMSIPGS